MNRDFRAHRLTQWPLMCLSVLLVLVLAMFIACEPEENGETSHPPPDANMSPPTAGTTHVLHIRNVSGTIEIKDAGGNFARRANRGDWVKWQNHTGADIELEFGRSHRLFGVWNAVSYSTGEPLTLQLREDAEYQEHFYVPKTSAITTPPPSIIINPPN
jgi:hypothetical protein